MVARAVSGDGEPVGSGPFFVASSFGREDSPHLAYSPQDNNFGWSPNTPPFLRKTHNGVSTDLNLFSAGI